MRKFILLLVISFLLPNCFGGDDGSTSSSRDLLAFNYSEDYVKQRLKSPSTAKFPKSSEKRNYITKVSDDEYIIEAWVDSQNGFGAMIRSSYSCVIIFEDGKVKCKDLLIE